MIDFDAEQQEFRSRLRERLSQYFADRSLEIETFSRRGEGYSWETYLVGIRRQHAGGQFLERFAVKREPSAGLLAPYNVQLEVDLLNAARHDVGCPVPGVVTFDLGADGSKGFYVMEMVPGVVPMPWDVKAVIPDEAVRRQLGLEIAAIMSRLHGKDIKTLSLAGMEASVDGRLTGEVEAQKWFSIYAGCAAARLPVIDLAFAWLKHSADAVSGRVSLVHNDLRVGNVIVHDGRVAAVLDWETAEFTDPVADLAKFNLPTFRGRSKLASGMVDWEEFLDTYEEGSGWRPTGSSLAYWSVMEITKAVVGALRGEHFFNTMQTNDIRYANMGFQLHHSIRWLVDLYEAGKWGR